ncbi:MAG: NitT/TauT family transport system ATP-binding protein [Bacillota bacterium]|nr:NitT/TauT family transport system ATP-binding protein [Bacillota bacterium]
MFKIEATNLKKTYGDLPTLADVSLTLAEGEFVAIIGPSGCGKSTLFNIISGLHLPDAGTVLIDGEDYTGRTGRVSYMHQKDLLLPWRTILDNVCLPLVVKGLSLKEARARARPYFPAFGLAGFEEHYPAQLSGGMRQRAALLRTYLFASDIMLLDEPFGALDALTRRKMQFWLLSTLSRYQTSVLLITHDVEEALLLSDRVYVLSERPARVKLELKVDLPRPRSEKTLTAPAFIALKRRLLKIL